MSAELRCYCTYYLDLKLCNINLDSRLTDGHLEHLELTGKYIFL